MSDPKFQEKLSLYREGRLNPDEAKEIEEEIKKVSAILDYVQEEEIQFTKDLSMEEPYISPLPPVDPKKIKRQINLRIVATTALTAVFVWMALIALYFLGSKIVTSLFAMDGPDAYVERSALTQIVELFQPDYHVRTSHNSSSTYARGTFGVGYERRIGHNAMDERELTIEYRFGKPKQLWETSYRMDYLTLDAFGDPSDMEGYAEESFAILERAPSGTTSKVFILFQNPLTPEEMKAQFLDPLYPDLQEGLVDSLATPLVVVDSKLVLAHANYYDYTDQYPFDPSFQEQNEKLPGLHQAFDAYDNQTHTDSMIGNLHLLKDREALLEVLFYKDFLKAVDLDAAIASLEKEGVRYFGAYFEADTKSILSLQSNPNVYSMMVEQIVLW